MLVTTLMKSLSRRRPVFHSEADFQHALAWQIQKAMQDNQVRLETPFPDEKENKHLDIWLPDMKIAIELKYKTRKLNVELKESEEPFELKDQGAQDIGRYGFIRDIRRLERHGRAVAGFAVLLTNDPLYWEEPSGKTVAQDEDFFLYDGRVIGGAMKWPATKDWMREKGVDEKIELDGSYGLDWEDYRRITEKEEYGLFRFLVVKVPCAAT